MDKVPTLVPEKSDQMAALPLGAAHGTDRSCAVASAPAAFRVRGWQITSGDRRATWEATAANVDHPPLHAGGLVFCGVAFELAHALGMRAPWGGGQQLDLLGGYQRPELHGEAVDEILVGEDRLPVCAAVGVVIELPEVDELIDHARVGLEVADQLLVLAALLERWVAELRVQLDRLAHLPDVERVRSELVDRHGDPPEFLMARPGGRRVVWQPGPVKKAGPVHRAGHGGSHERRRVSRRPEARAERIPRSE